MAELTDDDLIRLYRDGDAEAFETLFFRHATGVFHFCRMMLGDAGEAEDILQETFLAVARTARAYETRGRFRTWLMRIARNRCLNSLESAAARRRALPQTPLAAADPPCRQAGPALSAQRAQRLEAVRREIERLPERQREAIVLFAYEQMTYQQIAEVLEVPLNAVKTLIYRARAELARTNGEASVL